MDESKRDDLRRDYLHGDNPFRENPYASPELKDDAMPAGPPDPLPRSPSRGMVGHVPVLAILMIVQGAMEALMGLLYVGMGIFASAVVRMDIGPQTPPPPGMSQDVMSWFMLAVYGSMGLVALVAAGLHIWAGIRNYWFRSRTLGLVALACGMASVFTCYCAPTTIALGVYGLITLMNPEVIQAFTMGEAGNEREDILAAFR